MGNGTYTSEEALNGIRELLDTLAHLPTGGHQASDPRAYGLVRTLKQTAQDALKYLDSCQT
jgi:hypothetical protein